MKVIMPRNEINAQIEGYFGDLPIVEATAEMYLVPSEVDAVGAIEFDPANCINARCARRVMGTAAHFFYKTVAYVEMPFSDGHKIVRFAWNLTSEVRKLEDDFDEGRLVTFETIVLTPPKPWQTLEAARSWVSRKAAGLTRTDIGTRTGDTGRSRGPRDPKRSNVRMGIKSAEA